MTPLAVAEPSPLGFSAQDSLDLAAGEHAATLHWLTTTNYSYGPESGDSQLTVTITSLGSARFATQDNQAALDDLLCRPSVLTDVTVEFDSAGGAFHERFRGVLMASNADSATLSATLLGTHLAGSFAFDPATLAGRALAQITLNLHFSAGSFSGAISAGIQETQGSGTNSSVSFENVPLSCFGDATLPGQAKCTD